MIHWAWLIPAVIGGGIVGVLAMCMVVGGAIGGEDDEI